MALGKQAKTLSKGQVEAVLGYLGKTRNPSETGSSSCCQPRPV
jgi:hypothetical protein